MSVAGLAALVLVAFGAPDERVAIPAPPARTFERDPIDVQEVVLDNGLTVLLSENHERPEVFGAVVVRTGGRDDPADATGLSHYLEHMLFKGTTRLGTSDWSAERPHDERIVALYEDLGRARTPEARAEIQRRIGDSVRETYAWAIPNELDRLLAEIGSTGVNAFTTEDQTVYHNTFPASRVEAWLTVYAQRFREPVFRLFPTELEAVYEEKNISMDHFEVALFEAMMKRAFPAHPYGTQTILGDVEHLRRPSIRTMRRHYETYYVPGNMALVMAGDIDPAAVLPVIEREFGAWAAGPPPPRGPGTVAPFTGSEHAAVRLTPLRVGALAFRTVPVEHEDYPALGVARELLTNDQGSGLLDRLVDQGKLLILYAFPQDLHEHGLDVYFFAPRVLGQSFRRAEQLVLREVARLARGDVDRAQLLATRDALVREQLVAFESNEERALAIADVFARGLSWQDHVDRLERLRTLQPEDVADVAGRYLAGDHLWLRSRVGKPEKVHLDTPHYPPVSPRRGATSELYREARTWPRDEPRLELVDFDGDVERVAVRPGVVVARNENPHNDVYTLQLRFGVGTDAIEELAPTATYLLHAGSRAHPQAQFKRALSRLGTTMEVQATLERFVVQLQGPEEHLDAALALIDELMRAPATDPKRWRQLRREAWGLRRVQLRDPGFVAEALRDFALWGDESPHKTTPGPRTMRRLSPADLLDAWRTTRAHEVEIRYVGQRSATEVADLVDARLAFPAAPRPARPKVVHPRVLPAEPTVFFLPRRDAVQTHLWFAVDAGPIPADERPIADAYDAFMGGEMAGVVFQEVREFRALAYSASARFQRDPSPEQAGWLTSHVGCRADKTFEALDVVLGLVRELPDRPENVPVVAAALAHALETGSPGARELQTRIEEWRWSGHAHDPRRELLERYRTLAVDDLEQFFAARLAGRPIAIMVVGDPRRVDRRRLARLGKLRVVHERDLLSP
jgi:predicted Zn-dependent peptidase